MDDDQSDDQSSGADRRPRRATVRVRWTDVAVGAFCVLAVAVPTLAVEETWHGLPMIDQANDLWMIAACVVAAAFLVGGAIAGYRRPGAALVQATAVAGLAVAVLLVGDVSRRFLFSHQGVTAPVARLWCVGVVAAFVLSAAGSLVGRRITTVTH